MRRRTLTVIAATVALLAVGAARFGGTALVREQPVEPVDAIVSLASHEWERLPAASDLARMYPDAAVVLTLPEPATEFNCHDCAHRIDRLRHMGVAPRRVRIVPLTAGGTHGEALAVLVLARAEHLRGVLVVTSPYHTRRTLALFSHVFQGSGVQIGVRAARATSPARPGQWWRAPYDRAYVVYEWTAAVYYWWRYGVAPW